MRLTEQSRYALRVLAHCAVQHPALAKVATIAAVTGITEQNIFKLIKTLTKAGLVKPFVGHGGGACHGPGGDQRPGHRASSALKAWVRSIEERGAGVGDRARLDRTIGGHRGVQAQLDETEIAAGSQDEPRTRHRVPPRAFAPRR